MLQQITALLSQWLQTTRVKYGVDPLIFLILMTVCAPFFYYSIYRMVRAIAAKHKAQVNIWSMVFLLSTILPYLYGLVFGHGMPWWVYLIVAVLMAQGAYTLVLRRKGKQETSNEERT